jgi:iron complex outermembrane receptor protein
MLAYDPTYLLDNGVYTLIADQNPAVQTRNWAVKEDVQIAYAKFGIDSTVGSIPVTGNTGLQVVYTDQSSTGTRIDPATPPTRPTTTAATSTPTSCPA